MSSFFPDALEGTTVGEPRLELRDAGNGYVDGIDLTLRGGEIVGVAGLQGSGRTEVLEGIFGVTPFTRGELLVDGSTVTVRTPRQAVRRGLALITEDRKATGLALHQSILDNALGVVRAVFPSRTGAARSAVPSHALDAGRLGPVAVAGGAVPLGRQPAEGRPGPLALRPPRRRAAWTSRPAASTSAPSTRSTR